MAQVSRLTVDARAPDAVQAPAGTELLLRFATRVDAAAARAWQTKKREGLVLVAVVEVQELTGLDVEAWLARLMPDAVELRTPAWDAASMTAIGWPQGLAHLHGFLHAVGRLRLPLRLALHLTKATLASLTQQAVDALCAEVDGQPLDVRFHPVLGAHTPRLDDVATALVRLLPGPHVLLASQLWPTCALPEGMDADPVFPSAVRAAHLTFPAACAECVHRERRCLGLADDFARVLAEAGVVWRGLETLASAREPPAPVAEPDEPVEVLALELGLRHVWRADMPLDEAAARVQAPPPGLVAVAGRVVSFDAVAGMGAPLADNAHQIVYFARSTADAEAARDAEATPDGADTARAHDALGALLGYPACCRAAFDAAERERSGAEWDGVAENAFAALRAARRSSALDRRLNFTSPVADACFVRHNCCAYDCAPSLAQAEAIAAAITARAPRRAAALQERLADAVLLFADAATLPLSGSSASPLRLDAPTLLPLGLAHSNPGFLADRALAAVAPQLVNAVALAADHAIDGPGGVRVHYADGTSRLLDTSALPTHPQFPRLLVFGV